MAAGVLLAGPTACGKTELSLRVAAACDGEIISVDSCSVYRGMDIGSAKPSRAQQRLVRHHMLDIRSPSDPYNAGAFAADAAAASADIARRGKRAVYCGGTMLYAKTLLEGLSPIPQIAPDVKTQISEWIAENGLPAAHARLAQIDPDAAARLPIADGQRIARALAVHAATGRALSSWQKQDGEQSSVVPIVFVALIPDDRALLRERIAQRTEQMFADGLVEEVAQLISAYGSDIDALNAVGYRQVAAHLQGKYDLDHARSLVLHATSQLAKRQLTWLRRLKEKASLVLDPLASDCAERIVAVLKSAAAG